MTAGGGAAGSRWARRTVFALGAAALLVALTPPGEATAGPDRARTSWDGHGRPDKMIIVRPTSVDSLTAGALTRRIARVGTPATLARLASAVPSGWLTTTPGVVRLSAAVVLTPGVSLDVGGDGSTLALVGGATAPEASSIYTGGGTLTLHDVTVTSVDPASGGPLAAGPGRPFVLVSEGGRLDATRVTFRDLGTPADEPQDRAGVEFGTGSSGSLVQTTVQRNSTGVRLNGSTDVRLDGVTVTDSAADGLVLKGDRGTTMVGIRAERNGEDGVQVGGPSSDRPITGVTTTGNERFGLAVSDQSAPQIRGVITRDDVVGGLELAGDTDPVITDYTAADEPIGVLTHLGSTAVTLDRLRISGGGRGLVIEKTTKGLLLMGSTVRAAQTGISVGGHDIELRDVVVGDNRSGVRIERGAGAVTATALTITGGQDGVVVSPGTTDVVLRDLEIDGVANNGVRTAGPDARILGGRISGTVTGIDAGAATTISGVEITRVDVGIRARAVDLVAAQDVRVSAVKSGVAVQPGSPFVLTDSRIDAVEAVRGPAELRGLNHLSLPPLDTLRAVGVPLVVLALLLDLVHRFRQRRGRRDRRRTAPPPHP